jgi:predicted RND superfamily exporter protein
VLGALTGAAAAGTVDPRSGALRFAIDPSPVHLLPGAGPARDAYERARQLFGSDEPFVVALGADDVFAPEMLRRVARLTERLETLEHVHHVISLARAPDVRSRDGDIEIVPLLESVPEDAAGLARLRETVLGNPLYRGTLVAPDARTVALFVHPERVDAAPEASTLADRIEAVAREEAGGGPVWVSGIPYATARLADLLMRELVLLLPATVAVLCLVLAVAFRTWAGVLLPVATVSLALVWTLGLLGWLGLRLNLVTTMLPPLVVTVGFAYAMHVVAEFGALLQESPSTDRAARVALSQRAVDEVGVPVLLAGLTTCVGFLSLAFSPIVAVRELGLFAGLGVAFAVVAALTFTPAALALSKTRPVSTGREGDRLDRLARAVTKLALERRRLVIATACLAAAIALFGARRIEVATEFVGNLDRDARLRVDFEAVNERLGGANLIQVVVESPEPDAFLEPANLRALAALQAWLARQPEVGGTASLVDTVSLVNQAMHDGDPARRTIPETRRQVSQLLLFGATPETRRLVDARHQMANVVVRATVGDSRGAAALVARIRERLAELPAPLRGDVTGNVVLLGESIDALSRGQWTSFVAALAMIYLCLAALFTSLRVGLLALFPNLVPIALYYGALGFSGIPLNPWTSVVGSVALGIAADDTIHFMARFNSEARRLADERRALLASVRAVLRPITFTLLGLCLGFGVLAFSEIRSQAEFGLLAAGTLALGWVADVTVTPALCAGVRVVTLWDVLTFDLGGQPGAEIPLFRDMSKRQMRLFVLMGSVRSLPAGELLMRAGDPGQHGYLVLEGRLRSTLPRDDGPLALFEYGRGDVVGEVAMFSQQRSADVRALEDVRLVRFDAGDLERLRSRYPRTAALVYRNLNRIQSQRQLVAAQRIG